MTVARARCHQPLRRGRGGSAAAGADAGATSVAASASAGERKTRRLAPCSAALGASASTSTSRAGVTPVRLGHRLGVRDRVAGRRRNNPLPDAGEFFASSASDGGEVEARDGRLRHSFSVQLPKPVSLSAGPSRSTVTLLSAARTSAGGCVNLAALCNEIAADFGDDRQAVVRWLQGFLWKISPNERSPRRRRRRRRRRPTSLSSTGVTPLSLPSAASSPSSPELERLLSSASTGRRFLDNWREVLGQRLRCFRLAA